MGCLTLKTCSALRSLSPSTQRGIGVRIHCGLGESFCNKKPKIRTHLDSIALTLIAQPDESRYRADIVEPPNDLASSYYT